MQSKQMKTGHLRGDLERWRRALHQIPETAFEETHTAAYVSHRLREFGLEVHCGVGGTGVVGLLRKGRSSRSIGLRADLDAIAIREQNDLAYRSRNNGKMHACGHDGHTAMLLGAARYLATSGSFDGEAVFVFQPAEENGRGALAMIEDGLLDRFPMDEIYGLHNAPQRPLGLFEMRSGATMSNEDIFTITIRGLGGHASAPQSLRDPLVCGAAIVTALQTIVARTLDPFDAAVVSVTEFTTDGARNVIPGEVVLKGDARSFSDAVRAEIEASMRRVVRGTCVAHRCTAEVVYRHEFVATVNHPEQTAAAAAAATEVVGRECVDADCQPCSGSEDFAQLLRHRPGAYVFLGTGRGEGDDAPLHNPRYDFNDDALTIGADFWVRLVERQLGART